ncbi:MAG: Jag N-terminal domain-containing protein [Anaerolineae bacterium]|nr:Jag N-terminal domain-containing protein [Anaerolineae bacterium]
MPENQNAKNDATADAIEVKAKTVEEAIELGLAQLGLAPAQVEVEIIHEGKRGVFGLGSEEALVRLTPTRQMPEPKSEAAVSLPKETLPADETALSSEDIPPEAEESVAKVAAEILGGLLTRMGIEAEITTYLAAELVEAGEVPPLVLDVKGRDLGILIGRRSETLQVLQYMVRLMVSKHFNRWEPVVVDVESYRIRRRRSLQKMAEKMAERAVSTQRRIVLEAMPAHERRLIHLALRNHPEVYTKSIGSDDNRKVTIVPK